jgi:hypothetical protein
MKINEIIVESRIDEGPFLDRLKSVGQQAGAAIKQGAGVVANSNFVNSNSLLGGIKGAVQGAKSGVGVGQGFQAGVSRAQGTQFANQVVKIKMDKWNQALAQDPSLAQNPQALQSFMANDADAQRAGFVPELPTDMTPKGMKDYITKTTGEIVSKRGLGIQHQPGSGAAPTASNQPHPDVKLLNNNPMVIRYKTTDFIRNDQGLWAPATSPRNTSSQGWQAFLDGQEAILTAAPVTTPPPPRNRRNRRNR